MSCKPARKPQSRSTAELTSALSIIDAVYDLGARFDDDPSCGGLRIVCSPIPDELERLVFQREADIAALLAEHNEPATCVRCGAPSKEQSCVRCGHRSMDLPPPPLGRLIPPL